MKVINLILLLGCWETLLAQDTYGTRPELNEMVNTKLAIKPDLINRQLYGDATLTLQPHLQATDSLLLDAKGMSIERVDMIEKSRQWGLRYSYDGMVLRVKLDRRYEAGERYTIFIKYISKPDELNKVEKGDIEWAKGIYFVKPKNADSKESIGFWTQGETSCNSVWFPCIDQPNQKSTEEIDLTVPAKFVTLSNGVLFKQVVHEDHTRTDSWKLDLPHAPYLFFIGMGEYAIINDYYKKTEVSYYVEKDFAPLARKTFGHTPEMMEFFSRITGVEYPWPKYSQIVIRSFNIGMENTTATTLDHYVEQDDGDLAAGVYLWEQIICHELFHHWFGDLVTPENWGQLCLSESFANYGETLWLRYKFGKDAADETNWREMTTYLADPQNAKKPLVRPSSVKETDMFDRVSYSKGGRILQMLRSYVGDSAFFKSLKAYMESKRFGTANAEDLRRAFEAVTGTDLQWFWRQWFYGRGHPKLDISYGYDEGSKKAMVYLKQTQNDSAFKFPLTIDVYQGKKPVRYSKMVSKVSDTLFFPVESSPELIDVDPDRELICERTDHKTEANIIYQYEVTGSYFNRREAIDYFSKMQDDTVAVKILLSALRDPVYGLRHHTLNVLDKRNSDLLRKAEPILIDLAHNDSTGLVRAKAIEILGLQLKKEYLGLFMKALDDPAYVVRGTALLALSRIDTGAATSAAIRLANQDTKRRMVGPILTVLLLSGEKNFAVLVNYFEGIDDSGFARSVMESLAKLIIKMKEDDKVDMGIEAIVKFRDSQPDYISKNVSSYVNDRILSKIMTEKKGEGMTAQAEFIQSKINIK